MKDCDKEECAVDDTPNKEKSDKQGVNIDSVD